MTLQDRLIVITGGAGGIARATAPLLLAEGARLLLIDPDAAALEALAGERVRTAASALASPEECEAALGGAAQPI
jgi:NAD(P)-dependent dehydrogenase (short-subunit alcohol dehydrogenase family)